MGVRTVSPFWSILSLLVTLADDSSSAQSILTIAGGGTDDGWPATTVVLTSPERVAVDSTGSLFIADTGSQRIRRVDARTGVIVTVAGRGAQSTHWGEGGPATAADLLYPTGVAVDSTGNVFITDGVRVKRVDARTGILTTVAVNISWFWGVDDVAVDSADDVYFSEGDCIRRIDARSGEVTTVAGSFSTGFSGDGGPATAAELNGASGVAVDALGNVFFADRQNYRIRRVDARTGIITTVAGTGTMGYSGDGGPATAADLLTSDVRVDAAGNVFFSDQAGARIRRVDVSTGIVTTVAGTGSTGYSGDGGPATAAGLGGPPNGVVLDRTGNLTFASAKARRIRRVDARTGVITTVAGTGTVPYSGDGGPATAARLSRPRDVAVDPAGHLVIADAGDHRVRRVDARTGVISTVAGTGSAGPAGDGGPATAAELDRPSGVEIDATGNVLIADTANHRVRRIDPRTGTITTVAGTGTADGNWADGFPATATCLGEPHAVVVDATGSVIVSDPGIKRVRRVDSRTGILTTVAGSGLADSSGDGGPATAAGLSPYGLALDASGDLFLGDTNRIRRVDVRTGIISTVAGTGTMGYSGDGGPATAARLSSPDGIALDAAGNVLIADSDNHRLRRVDARTGVISTVAGNGSWGLSGDGGPATAAGLNYPSGVAVDRTGNVFVAGGWSGRVHAIYACRDQLGAFDLSYPDDGTLSRAGTFNLGWAEADGAFRYDLFVDTDFPPRRLAQQDVSGQGFQLSGLVPGKTYYWQVEARGDPYCPKVTRPSGVRRFTVLAPCLPPAPPVLSAPAVPSSTTALSFSAVPGAGSYDLYLGSGPAPALAAAGLTTTSYVATGLEPGTAYTWRVVARASCHSELTSSSAESRFVVPGQCDAPAAPTLTSPPAGAIGLSRAPFLTWEPSSGASTYDLHLGPGTDPPLFASGLAATSFTPVALDPGTTYRWRVIAHAACDTGKVAPSSAGLFATSASCPAPAAPRGLSSTKAAAFHGTPYVLSWSAEGLQEGGLYRIERSTTDDFAVVETFTTRERSLVLPASRKTTYRHRVFAVAPCGSASAPSAVLSVLVSSAPPFVAMTGPPRATIITQPPPGFPLPRLGVTLWNTGTSDFVGFFNTAQSVPFFTLSETAISLRAGEVRTYFLQFSGVPADSAGTYEGLLTLVSADPTDGAAYPQAPVSLRITGQKPGDPVPPSAAPTVLKDGRAVDSVAFAPAPVGQAPVDLAIDIRNPGTAPLDLVADVLPDPWLTLVDENGGATWNSSPIAPGATRRVILRSQRTRGASGGAFPRFTHVTLRTVDGQARTLLVEDAEPLEVGSCRGRPALEAGEGSLLVPSIVNAPSATGGNYVSRLLLTNLGTDPLQAALFYTPDSGDPATDGYDCTKVLQASLVLPAGDVAALTDPVGKVFGLERSSGSLEIRSSRIGQLRVQSVVHAPAASGGSFGFQLPTVPSGAGARQGRPYAVIGVVQNASYRTNVILAETSGQRSSVKLSLYDREGALVGTASRDLPPYAKTQLPVTELSGGRGLDAGAIEVTANEGSAGSVIAVTTVIDRRTGDASSFVAKPLQATTTSKSYAVPSVVHTTTFQSRLEIRNNDSKPVTYRVTYRGTTGTVESQTRTLTPRQEDAWDNVLGDLLALPAGTYGQLGIVSDSPNLQVVSRVYASTADGTYGDAIEGVALDDPRTTGESGRILAADGLEGTADGDRSRGARTNLIVTEIGGGSVEVELSLWEKTQERIAPFARETLRVGPHELVQLNDVFAALGAGQKDRLNVLAMLRPEAGSTGRVVALATRIDNLTNDTKNLWLGP